MVNSRPNITNVNIALSAGMTKTALRRVHTEAGRLTQFDFGKALPTARWNS